MMKKIFGVIFFLTVLSFSYGATSYNVSRSVLTDAIVQKEPAPHRELFYFGERAVFFTELTDIGVDEKRVFHNWYLLKDDGTKEMMASVPLKIKGYRWRTWSSKNLYNKGNWIVDLTDDNGVILESREFIVQ
ncbi:DUF2914 domain-containing protein [uncultured Ilyobacter sp.]|uniref:DUF2914 domain-containing protein n=1 Tax=uncultured Ilyobacter sp. TaxID=544433 RepID=UPI0029F55AA9|nr:DUF2914 domain-containing protein [uncultured Ilyobacter sp.]